MDGWVERLILRAERKALFRSESALHEALYASVSLEAVNQILRLHPEATMIQDQNGRLPLHWALLSKNQHGKARLLLEYLVERKEQFHLKEMLLIRNDLGYTALDHACCSDAPADIMEILLSICPEAATLTNARRMGKTPLHMLLEYNKSNGTEVNNESAQLLLKAYPEALRVGDRFGNLPLHYISYQQTSYEALNLVLAASMKMGCVKAKNDLGRTCLHTACINNAPSKMIQTLLEASPTMVYEMDNEGETPLHLTFMHKTSVDLKIQLIHFGGESLLGVRNHRGRVPLQQGLLDEIFDMLVLMPFIVRCHENIWSDY